MDFFEIINSQANFDDITGLPNYTANNITPASVPVRDVTDNFLVNEELPSGDFRINYAEGIETDVDTVNLGEINSSLSSIFDPNSANSFSTNLELSIEDTIIDYLIDELSFWF